MDNLEIRGPLPHEVTVISERGTAYGVMEGNTIRLTARSAPERTRMIFDEVLEQEAWMAKCGGDRAGYRKKYGDPDMPTCYGNGGTAIYEADLAYLNKLKALAGVE